MNDKTAKLIRKYAGRTSEDQNAVRRKWLSLSHEEKRRFRLKMKSALTQEETPTE
jgi:hypothetical protein